MSWVSLHNHSIFSMLDGLSTPFELMQSAKDKGCPAIALTDHGSISGFIQLAKASKELGVKPIYGVEAYFVDNVLNKDRKSNHIVLLAKNNNGLRSLFSLLTKAHENFYYTPRIDMAMLDEAQDIIVMSACAKGLLAHPNYKKIIKDLKCKFGEDFYLEVMPIQYDPQIEINKLVQELSQEYKCVITQDAHYCKQELAETHSFMMNMKTGGSLTGLVEGLYIRNREEIIKVLQNEHRYFTQEFIQNALNNTLDIADKCNVNLEPQTIDLPSFVEDPNEFIQNKARTKLTLLCLNDNKIDTRYFERLQYELDIIKDKGFASYFVLAYDLCEYARQNNFEMPVGRGSAGGSLLCWLLGIHQLDPIKYNLMFERFLNPERTDWPDIDLDFEDVRREELLHYLKEKYGDDKVANISTFSELKTKSAFKDVVKSYEFEVSDEKANIISKFIDNNLTLKENIAFEEGLGAKDRQSLLKGIPKLHKLVKYTDDITGCYRQAGKHAAGIVVSSKPLVESCVLENRKGVRVINWDMKDAEYMGLIKLDLLGLRTLSIIKAAKDLIKERHGVTIKWEEINTESEDVLQEFGKGNTIGCMQFESNIQRSLLRQMNPIVTIDNIIDSNALGRPGPLESKMVDRYCQNKRNPFNVNDSKSYDEYLKNITKKTYGVIVYQEQIIEILMKIAGYSTAESDIMRRIIAKSKGEEEWKKHTEQFIEGCRKTVGMESKVAEHLFNDLKFYSKYSFNRSHAAAYAVTAMRQMWLKINYPVEYMCALFNYTSEPDKILSFKNECRRLNVPINNVDVVLSKDVFTINNNELIPGFGNIKGIGPKTVSALVKSTNADYQDLKEFRIRFSKKQVDKTALKALAISGALNRFNINIKKFIENIDAVNNMTITSDIPNVFKDDVTEDYSSSELDLMKMDILPGIYTPDIKIGLKYTTNKLYDTDLLIHSIQNKINQCDKCELRHHYKVEGGFNNITIKTPSNYPGAIMVVDSHPNIKRRTLRDEEFMCVLYNSFPSFPLNVYYTYLYKCYPLEGALPENIPHDCYRFLDKEIEILEPNIIVAFGSSVHEYFIGKKYGIMSKNGTTEVIKKNGKLITVFWMMNPASRFISVEHNEVFKNTMNSLVNILQDAIYL